MNGLIDGWREGERDGDGGVERERLVRLQPCQIERVTKRVANHAPHGFKRARHRGHGVRLYVGFFGCCFI